MGLGGTAKKLQKVVNAAEELYAKMNEVIGQLNELRDEVEMTSQQVDHIEYDLAEQRVLLEALAEQQGVDVEATLADADLPPEPDEGEEGEEGEKGEDAAATDAESGTESDGNSTDGSSGEQRGDADATGETSANVDD